MPTLEDIERMLAQTRHTSRYNIPRTAQMLHMRYVQHMPIQKIADTMGMSPSAVSTKLRYDVYRLLYVPTLTDADREWLPTPESMRRKTKA